MIENERYKLYQGDCLEVMDKLIESGLKVDAIITDPPYGTTQNKWDSVIPFDELWREYKRIIKDNGAIVLFGSEPFASKLRMSNIKNYKYDWYWNKNKPSGAMIAKKQPMKAVETISVFYKNQCVYNPQMIKRTEEELKRLSKKSVYTIGTEVDDRKWGKSGNRNDNKLKYPKNILNHKTVFNRSKEKVPHPTQKLVDLLEYLIKTYTNEGDLVLDFTMGSGSTGVACMNTNRKFIGIEIEEKYFNIAKDRMRVAVAKNRQKRLF